jgi:hypothetical protein
VYRRERPPDSAASGLASSSRAKTSVFITRAVT